MESLIEAVTLATKTLHKTQAKVMDVMEDGALHLVSSNMNALRYDQTHQNKNKKADNQTQNQLQENSYVKRVSSAYCAPRCDVFDIGS